MIFALIISLAAFGFSYAKIQQHIEASTTTVRVLVPKDTIEAYSVVTSDNLTTIAVPPNITDENTALSPEQIEDRIAVAPLYAGKPIDIRTVISKAEDLEEKQVVGVYIDPARCAGVNEGDLVDIYRISPTSQGEAAPKIAQNCRVLRVTDDKGVSTRGVSVVQSAAASANLTKPPRIVYLLVSPQEVPYVIQGSAEQSYLSLSKKTKETIDPVVEVKGGR